MYTYHIHTYLYIWLDDAIYWICIHNYNIYNTAYTTTYIILHTPQIRLGRTGAPALPAAGHWGRSGPKQRLACMLCRMQDTRYKNYVGDTTYTRHITMSIVVCDLRRCSMFKNEQIGNPTRFFLWKVNWRHQETAICRWSSSEKSTSVIQYSGSASVLISPR